MTETSFWGYESIYGSHEQRYQEPCDADMRDALNYLCARVRRSGDFWNALRTASSMYGVNYNDLRSNFEKRKKAGIKRSAEKRNAGKKWYAVRYSSGQAFNEDDAEWIYLQETSPEQARNSVIRKKGGAGNELAFGICMSFKTRDEARKYTEVWDREHMIRQLPLFRLG